MNRTARIEHQLCRRQAPRYRLGMPARLITLDKHLDVVLEDLSEMGAKVTLPELHAFPVGALKWMDQRTVGLQFASAISAATLEQTVRYAPGLVMRIKPGSQTARR